jgi:hypothetical protein
MQLTEAMAKRDFRILSITWWINALLAVPLLWSESLDANCALLVASTACSILCTVYWCRLQHRHWTLLQGHGGRTDPDRAVAFCFIPVFWLYWWHVVTVGLAKDTNRYLESSQHPRRMSVALAWTVYIQLLLTFLLLFSETAMTILLATSTVSAYLFLLQQQTCVLEILARERETQISDHGN